MSPRKKAVVKKAPKKKIVKKALVTKTKPKKATEKKVKKKKASKQSPPTKLSKKEQDKNYNIVSIFILWSWCCFKHLQKCFITINTRVSKTQVY